MSNIYVLEPNTNGKVVLETTFGELEIDLWSKETPKVIAKKSSFVGRGNLKSNKKNRFFIKDMQELCAALLGGILRRNNFPQNHPKFHRPGRRSHWHGRR